MKIANSEHAQVVKENEEILKRMNKGLERKIATKEQEIKQVNSLYDKKIEQAKIDGEADLSQGLDENQQRLIGESNLFEEKIKSYQDRLKKAQETVTTQETALKNGHQTRVENMKTQMEENFQDQFANTQEKTRGIQATTQDVIKEISAKSNIERNAIESNSQYQISALSSDLNTKSTNIEKDYRSKLDSDIKLHNAEVARQRDELKNVMLVEAQKNKRLNDEKIRVSQDQLTYQDKYQQELLKQRDTDFKIRYENAVKEHESILKDISTRLEVDVKKMIEKTTSEKKISENRVEDPFYRVETLNPKMTEDLKTVTIALPIAEYEKENVHLSTQGRLIKMTLSRKFTDNMTAQDGSLNKSTRGELYSKEFKTTDLLSSKEITQSFENGVLTFKIKKA